MRSFIVVWLLVISPGVLGEDLAEDAYQLLRSDPAGYAEVVPGKTLQFPVDHLPHKDFRIEWWYITANLEDEAGQSFAVQWTLFRQSMSPDVDPGSWQSNQVWMAHGALTTPDGHIYEERFARGGIQQANVAINESGQFEAFIDNWLLLGASPDLLPATLSFSIADYDIKLDLSASTPLVLQGDGGYSIKSEQGQASYYYSQPHLRVSGTIANASEITTVSGQGWIDREWSSQPLAANQPGWDWLSLHLDDGHALMVYQLRQQDQNHWISGSWVSPEGQATTLRKGDVVMTPLDTQQVEMGNGKSRELPLTWRVELPGHNLSWTVRAQSPDQWLKTAFPYWEGPVDVQGSNDGVGFMELTGY